nr:MAG TPA: Synaptobrevin [Bacteriophage sp.]
MDKLTREPLTKEQELELAMLQIKYESESIANQLEFQRQVRETNQKMNNMIGYMSIGGLIVTIIFFVIVAFTLR